MGRVQNRHAGRFVHAAALHADEAVLDNIDPPHAVAAADRVQFLHHRQRRFFLAVERHRHAGLKADRKALDFVRRLLRRNGHAEVDQLDAVD